MADWQRRLYEAHRALVIKLDDGAWYAEHLRQVVRMLCAVERHVEPHPRAW